ncbi:MAG: H-type lectin domain-containing protein [Chloroflexota bacterium]
MQTTNQKRDWRLWLLPTPGNTILLLLVISGVLWARNVGAISLGLTNTPTATTTIPYQGRLTDGNGNPISGTKTMAFSLYNQVSGGTALWTESRTGDNSVTVTDGLFNVMLGSVTSLDQSIITANSMLYLGITVGTNPEISPRVQLGRVPLAVHALQAETVADRSITAEKLADNSVTAAKLNIDVKQTLIQGSLVHSPVNWDLQNGKGDRAYTETITFDQPFDREPAVWVSLSRVDIENTANQRIEVYSTNITQDGFDLVFKTWSDTRVAGASAMWIAYTSP